MCFLTEMVLWTANIDAINNFTKKMEDLKRKRDELKVTLLSFVFSLSGLTIVDLLCTGIFLNTDSRS